MLGNCSWLWLRRCSLPYSLLATILTWFLVLTVGSFGHGAASSVHDGGNRPAASSWSATGGRKADEEEAYVQGRFAEVLANVPERDVPAYRALGRGIELYEDGDLDASISQYRLAIELKHGFSSAWVNLGVALTRVGRDDEAMDAYEVVGKLRNALPADAATAFCNQGHLVQTRAGADYVLIEEGNSLFRRGLERVPEHANCLYNFGLGMEKLGRYPEAKDLYIRALEANPSIGSAHQNIGNIEFRLGNWTAAISRYERAHASPDADQRLLKISSFMLGQLYRYRLGDVRTAVEYYKRALDIDNTYTDAVCSILQALRSLCLWEGWESLEPQVASAIVGEVSSGREPGPQSPYETRLTGELKPSQHLGLARLASQQYDRVSRLPLPEETNELSFWRTIPSGRWGQQQQQQQQQQPFGAKAVGGAGGPASFNEWPHGQGIGSGTGKEEFPRRLLEGGGLAGATTAAGLVVAYWSFDYREHAMGHLTQGLLCGHQIHDRVFAVAASYGPDDESPVRRSAETCAGKFLDVSEAGHAEAAKAVVAERPQIFVDLMAHTTEARPGVMAMKPAPIVASYLGYPGTVGAEHTDYTIADRTVVPPELANVGFSEKMVLLPNSYQVNSYNVSSGFCLGGEDLLACQASIRSSRGLGNLLDSWGGRGPVLCNYNSIHKMEPESFTVFMNIVKRVPGSVLLLLAFSRDPANDPEVNIKAEAAARGVHPDRIRLDEMLSREEHIWRASGSCDLFVDNFVYGAHTTAADALWAGLPLLTLRGYGVDDTPVGQMSGRVGTSLLSALGLPELSFHTVKELEDAAVALVQSPGRLATLRRRLLSAAMESPLFDTRLVTRNLERAYEAMWEQRALGLPPSHIVVDPIQGEVPLSRLELEEPGVDPLFGGGTSKSPSEDAGKAGKGGGQRTTATAASASAANEMVVRAAEKGLAWAETGTQEGAEAALAVSGRLLAEKPLSVEALHLRGLALHLLGRQSEAIVVLERAALIATSRKHEQPDLNLGLLWGNWDAVQQEGGPRYSPVPSLLKALAANPSQPTPLRLLLQTHLRSGDHAACADDFWKHWAKMRGHRPSPGTGGTPPQREGASPEGFGDGWAWDAWREGGVIAAAKVVNVAAVCFAELGRLEEAWRAWKLAAQLEPANEEAHLRFAASLNKAGHQEEAHHEFRRIVKALNHVWFHEQGGSAVPKIARPEPGPDGRPPPKVVAFYCFEYGNAWFPKWGPSNLGLGTGLGGSEEGVVHLSRALADLGFWVEIYADPEERDEGRDHGFGRDGGGVVWYPYKAYDMSRPPDVFVAWRYHVSLPLAEGSGRRLLWLHDVVAPMFWGVADTLDRVVCPSQFHVSVVQPEAVRSLARVLPNGIDHRNFKDGINSPDLFVYGSAPNRGLRAVLLMWPYIRSQIPTATLEVYYGFSPNFLKWGKDNLTNFDEWMADMKRLLSQGGVIYKGMVGQDTLHDAYARAGFLLYPTAFPETGCVALLKAMAMGSIPITSRFANSTLPELTSEWDMGPRHALVSHLGGVAEHDMEWLETWAKAVVHASQADHAERLDTNPKGTQRDTERGPRRSDDDGDGGGFSHDIAALGEGNFGRNVQARRGAMKAAVRKQYAFSTTAQLWVEEIQREQRAEY